MQAYFSALIRLWAVSTGLGLMAFPLIALSCSALRDGGFAAAKVLSIVLVGYGAWLFSSLSITAFGLASIISVAALLAIASASIWLMNRRQIAELVVGRLKEIVATELVFVAILALVLFSVGWWPDITPASEGMMDIGILNSVARTNHFPAQDAWMANNHINYYYFGHVLVAALAKLCGMTPVEFYNPAKGLVFALFWLLVFNLGWTLTGQKLFGLLALFFVCIAGNLDALGQILSFESPLFLDWFGSTRLIPGTINEFPFFSLLWGDLHAYVLAFPLFATSLCLLYCLHFRLKARPQAGNGHKRLIGLIVLLALTNGALLAANAWDFASTSLLLMMVVVSMLPSMKKGFLRLGSLLGLGCAPVVGSILLFLPFLLSVSQRRTIGLVRRRTDLADFIIVFGILLMPILFEALFAAWGRLSDRNDNQSSHAGRQIRQPSKSAWTLPIFTVVCIFVAIKSPTWAFLLLLVPLSVLAFYRVGEVSSTKHELRRPNVRDHGVAAALPAAHNSFVRILVIAGATIAFGCEMFFLQDAYGEKYERMNTVFKLYLHVWILWGLAASWASWAIRRHLWGRLGRAGRGLFWAIATLCLVAGAIYPALAPISRTNWFSQGYTLACDRQFKKELPNDARAAQWLFKYSPNQLVIAEATAGAYSWAGRMSSFTGHCAVVGWYSHEAGWRGGVDEPNDRAIDIDYLYLWTEPEDLRRIIQEYQVELVYFGELEIAQYGEESRRNFGQAFETVYESGSVKVFDVTRPRDHGN